MKIPKIFRKTKKLILDMFFPIQCLGCKKYDHWICHDCHSTFPVLTEQHCFICKENETKNGEICPSCKPQTTTNLKSIFIASTYQNNLLKKSVHHFKYRFIEDLADPLALLIAQALQNSNYPAPDVIIPVPLHKKRLRWRGFNQAEKLAEKLDLKIPIITDSLIRSQNTTPQVKVKSREKRLQNLNNAFSVINKENIENKRILLIDDIVTTGTTLSICADELIKAGASEIRALVLARE